MSSARGRWRLQLMIERLAARPYLGRVLKNTSWLFADRILRLGVGLVVGIWIARYLGPQQYGLLSYAVAFVALFSTLATLGLDSVVVRDLVRDPQDEPELLGTTFALKLAGGALVMAVTLPAILLLRPGEPLVACLVALSAAGTVFQAFDTIDFWFQAKILSKFTVYAKTGAFLVATAAKVWLILAKAPLVAFAAIGLAEIALGSLGLVVTYKLAGQAIRRWRVSWPRAKAVLSESWPLMLSGFAIVIYMKIDQLMLGSMLGDEAVGVYSAATRISEAWYFVPTAIVSSVFPALVSIRQTDERLYYHRLQRLFDWIARLAMVIALPMTFLAIPLVQALFGERYAAAGPMLAVHIWSAVFVFLGVAQGPWNLAEGYTRLTFHRTLIGAIVNILLNLVLIPAYAGMGASIATVVAYASAGVFANAWDERTRRIFRMQLKALVPFRIGR